MTTHTITVDEQGNGRKVNPHEKTHFVNDEWLDNPEWWRFEKNQPWHPAPGLKPGEYENAELIWQYWDIDKRKWRNTIVPGYWQDENARTIRIWVLASEPVKEEKTLRSPKLWELVKACEDDKENWHQRYGEAKATMQVNFGPNARKYPDLITNDDNLNSAICKVFEHFHAENERFRKALEEIANCEHSAVQCEEIAKDALKPKE